MRLFSAHTPRHRIVSTERLLIVAVLLGTVTVALILAYRAYDASRSTRATVERAAAHYASVATWEFARAMTHDLGLTADATIAVPVERAIRAARGTRAPALRAVERAARAVRAAPHPSCDCPKPLPVATFVRLDFRGGADEIDGPVASPDEPGRLRALIGRALADSTSDLRHTGLVCDLLLYAPPGGAEPRVASVVLVRSPSDELLAAYVAESPLAALRPALARVTQRVDLLPPALLSRSAQRSALALQVRAGNHVVFSQGGAGALPFAAADSVGSVAPRLIVRARLTDEGARRMLLDGVSGNHLPSLIALVTLAIILLAVALLQIVRGAQLERLRSDFVASVSHELQTPLALVNVYAETLLRERAAPAEDHVGFLHVILRETRRLARLVENVLRFSEIERGTTRLQPSPTRLAPLIRAATADFEPLARARGASIIPCVDDDPVVRVDEVAFRQILFNLLSNAVKYGPEGQRITMALAVRDGMASVTIDDEGPGIPEAQRRRAFERYVRLTNVQRTAIAGAGIGLAVVRELARAQQIDVRLDAAPSGGARAILTMAVVARPEALTAV